MSISVSENIPKSQRPRRTSKLSLNRFRNKSKYVGLILV